MGKTKLGPIFISIFLSLNIHCQLIVCIKWLCEKINFVPILIELVTGKLYSHWHSPEHWDFHKFEGHKNFILLSLTPDDFTREMEVAQ